MEDTTIIECLSELIDSRVQFFGRSLNSFPHGSRIDALTAFLATENAYIGLMNNLRTGIYASTINMNIVDNTNFASVPNNMENVRVVATTAQIDIATTHVHDLNGNCAICQEVINDCGTRIIHCQHEYHTTCLNTWFTMSVRCPVCRYDIRESMPTDPVNQTLVASE